MERFASTTSYSLELKLTNTTLYSNYHTLDLTSPHFTTSILPLQHPYKHQHQHQHQINTYPSITAPYDTHSTRVYPIDPIVNPKEAKRQ